ncbi:unnamed protein product [Lactuca saligna]|uniref:Uncharacterized protein n=1 Tax=Lactuca saligna TaxID=75948 RepID=A0AA35V820_LACSI|nr:unnamed protein product [Lactuca saligna]
MKRARASIQGMQKKDMFLNKLCPNDEEEEDPTAEQLPPVYPMHNSEQEWDQMAPVLGMKFTNPSELKHCLTNYAVKHGYDLWTKGESWDLTICPSIRKKIADLKDKQR